MNWDQVKGNWKQLKGGIQERWGKLTNDDLDVINGRREKLIGLIQERYGIAKDQAEVQINRYLESREDLDEVNEAEEARLQRN